MKILLAEDDMRLGELVVHMLKKKGGHTADWVTTGREACEYAEATNYDVLILDWMMPEGDGVWACRQLRKEGYMGAILMLTAKDGLRDRINGLDAGADDYLVKPFEIEELLARLRALSRRNFAPIQGEEVQVPGLILNRTNQTASIAGELVQLIQNKGITLTREVILDRIWGLDADVGPKAIDAMIKLLRKKLSGLDQELIQSIRGVGYKIEA